MRSSLRRKNSTKIFIAVTLIAALSFGLSNYFINKANEVVVAKVNDQKILKSEIEAKLHSAFDGQNQELKIPEVENLPKEVIEILAKEIYLDKELTKQAKKSDAAKTPEIKAQIEDAKNKILRTAYLDSMLKEEITDQKISDKYAELSNDLTGKKEYLVSHIVTKTKEEAEKILRDLKAKKSPASFAEMAKRYSIDQESSAKGGELGFILEDNMVKEISEAITTLKPGEVSNPVQTKFGWHLVKFSESREAKAIPFESAKFNIRNQLLQNKINEINSAITKDAKVQILISPKEVEKTPEAKPAEQNPTAEAQPAAAQPAPEGSVQLQPAEPVAQKQEQVQSEEAAVKADNATSAEEEKVEEKSDEKQNEKPKSKKSKHSKKHR